MKDNKLAKEQYKIKIKQNKIESNTKKALIDIEYSKETTDYSMKYSFEELEKWKAKELSKGKDIDKVEKRYQKGLKTLKRLESKFSNFNEKMKTNIEQWEFWNDLKFEQSFQKKIVKKISTSSLMKMEKMLNDNPNTDLRFLIAGFCGSVRRNEINPIKFPNLTKEIKKWDEAINEAIKTDEYYKIFLFFVSEQNTKEKKELFKINAANKINEILENENISIRFISEFSGIKYSNVYNFLKKDIYTDLSFKRAHKLLWHTVNLKNGWTKEESLLKHSEKIKELKDYWDKDLLS